MALQFLRLPPDPIRNPEDLARMRAVLRTMGYDCPDSDLQRAYRNWSRDYWAAGWAGLPRDDPALKDILAILIRSYLTAD